MEQHQGTKANQDGHGNNCDFMQNLPKYEGYQKLSNSMKNIMEWDLQSSNTRQNINGRNNYYGNGTCSKSPS